MIIKKEKRQVTEQEALNKLAALCAKAEHCIGEMKQKMYAWHIDSDVQQRIIAQLVRGKYIDEERYTRAFVNEKINYNQWGRRKIEQALYQKGVAKDIYNKVLDEVDDYEYVKILMPLLRNKQQTISAKTDYERSMKLIKYAMGRGFDISIIRQCVEGANEWIDD